MFAHQVRYGYASAWCSNIAEMSLHLVLIPRVRRYRPFVQSSLDACVVVASVDVEQVRTSETSSLVAPSTNNLNRPRLLKTCEGIRDTLICTFSSRYAVTRGYAHR